jgi:hypothetical protein
MSTCTIVVIVQGCYDQLVIYVDVLRHDLKEEQALPTSSLSEWGSFGLHEDGDTQAMISISISTSISIVLQFAKADRNTAIQSGHD